MAKGIVVLAVIAIGAGPALGSRHFSKGIPIGSIQSAVPRLRAAVALGTLQRIDTKANLAQFRIRCGWHLKPRRRVRSGAWKVDLRNIRFGWETNPTDPAAPSAGVESIGLGTWVARSRSRGWTGTLRLSARGGVLTNGPTTNVCGGVLG